MWAFIFSYILWEAQLPAQDSEKSLRLTILGHFWLPVPLDSLSHIVSFTPPLKCKAKPSFSDLHQCLPPRKKTKNSLIPNMVVCWRLHWRFAGQREFTSCNANNCKWRIKYLLLLCPLWTPGLFKWAIIFVGKANCLPKRISKTIS